MKKISIRNPFSKKGFSFKKVYKSIENYITAWDLKKIAKYMTLFAVLIALVGGYLWYSRMYMTDERRFWLALENSMATQSVTRTVTSGGTGNQVVQDQQFFFAPQMVSRSHVTFEQKSATIDTSVETEGISFPDSQYSRYTSFRTNQQKTDGTLPNLDNVLGKWEGSTVSAEELENSKLNYISENVTLAIFGNYGSTFRNDVLKQLKNTSTYEINYSGVRDDVLDDKKVMYVPVSINLHNYATQLQRAFVEAGYGEFPPLDPTNYAVDSRINAQFTIDKKNNSIVGIQFGSRSEVYKGYGIGINVEAPQADFSSGELEQIVQEEIGSAL